MGYKLIAEGGILDATDIANYESYYDEGDKAVLDLYCRAPIPSSIISQLDSALRAAGVEGLEIKTGSPRLLIYCTKGFPWLAVIVAVILGIIALAILVWGWKLWKEVVPEGGEFITWGILAAAAIVAIILLTRRRAK
jgi:hypothetical protein